MATATIYPKLRFFHFRSENGRGAVSIGYYLDSGASKAYYTLARCCPTDNFCRWKGRLICEGRMRKYGPTGEYVYKDYEDLKNHFLTTHHPDAQVVLEHAKAEREAARYLRDPNKKPNNETEAFCC